MRDWAAYFLAKGVIRVIAPLWLLQTNVSFCKWLGLNDMAVFYASIEPAHLRVAGVLLCVIGLVLLWRAARIDDVIEAIRKETKCTV